MIISNNLSENPCSENLASPVVFNRKELELILRIYGRMVASGQWRDYGISMLHDVSIFSIYKHASEHPIYRVEKKPQMLKKQGMYSVIAFDGRILKRGHELGSVLKFFEAKLIRAIK